MNTSLRAPAYTRTSVEEGPRQPTRGHTFISVAVPTCNRPDDLTRLLASLGRVRYPRWELLLIDQSDDNETWQLAAAWGALLPEIHYLRLQEKNLSVARNLAIEHAKGEVIAFLDDDCTVTSDWLDRVSEAFAHQPEAGLIFGAVTAADHDPTEAFIPAYDVQHETRLRGSLGALRVQGMGASMYVRPARAKLPGFDVLLGAGARFQSAEDWDYAYRLMAAGGVVVNTPRIVVMHHGARSYSDGEATLKLREYFYGIGASHAKLLRCGEWIMLAVIVEKLTWSIALLRPQNALVHRPTQFGRLLMYVRGLRDGLRAPIYRQTGVFGMTVGNVAIHPTRAPAA